MTATLDLKDPVPQLDARFAALDDGDKLVISLMTFAQCAVGYRRMIPLHQINQAAMFSQTESWLPAAEATGDPVVIESARKLRALVEAALADPPPCNDSQFLPVGEAFRRDFLWSDAYEEPIYYDMRHAARDALNALKVGGVPAPPPA